MAQPAFFQQTNWSTVIEAKAGEETVRHAALERLLTRYRHPILLEMQSRARCNEAEAEELTHRFIHNCLRRDFLQNIDPQKGRFRSFIKACIANFLKDVHRESAAEPPKVSLQETDDEGHRLIDPPAETMPPDVTVDIHWARQVIALSLQQLEQECIAARRGDLFTGLKPFLDGDSDARSYASVATRLNINEGALRTAAHRLRHRLGEIIEEEIKQTLGRQEEWKDELRYFLDLLGRAFS